jgi:hypothetical protein
MSLYARGVVNSMVGPYRDRASTFKAGALDLYRGGQRFYARGIQVGGVKSGIINFLIDLVHIMLVAGGVYLVLTSIF